VSRDPFGQTTKAPRFFEMQKRKSTSSPPSHVTAMLSAVRLGFTAMKSLSIRLGAVVIFSCGAFSASELRTGREHI